LIVATVGKHLLGALVGLSDGTSPDLDAAELS
jgi:hypothetical protein